MAKRVRVLHVYPGFLKQLHNTTIPIHRDRTGNRPLRTRLTDLATSFVFPKNRKLRPFKFRTPEQVVQEMLDVFYHLPNVTDYHIMWSGLQPIPNSSPVPLLAALFHGPALRTLSLEISLENIQSLLTPAQHIRNLEELTLTLRLDHDHNILHDHAHILTHHLAPAISHLHPSLRKLTIQSWEAHDLAPLFRALAFLPHLHHLTLSVPIQPPHLGHPRAIAAFLHRQRTTLHSLALRTTQYSGSGLVPDPSSLDAWITAALTHTPLPALATLDMSSPLLPPSASLACLRHFARGIKSLGVTGRYQAHDDVQQVVRAFRGAGAALGEGGLETLRLGSVSLTPQLVDLLASEMPGLDRLELLVRDLGPSSMAGGGLLDVDKEAACMYVVDQSVHVTNQTVSRIFSCLLRERC